MKLTANSPPGPSMPETRLPAAGKPQLSSELAGQRSRQLPAREDQAEIGASEPGGALRVAYVMSHFPKLTETFVQNEIVAVQQLGAEVQIYPLLRKHGDMLQPGAAELAGRAFYHPFISRAIVASNLHFLRRTPQSYLRTLAALLRGNFGSLKLFVAGVILFPKMTHMARMMAAAGIDHVHCHFATHAALAGFVIRRLVGIPYSFTAHGSDIHLHRRMLCEKVSEAKVVVAIARVNKALIEAECGTASQAKISVVHCGVDTDVFRPRPAAERPNTRQAPLGILCVGTLHEVKGQRHLIDACVMLRDMGVAFRCEFLGAGPDAAKLRRLVAQRGLEDHVDFAGQGTQADVIERLRRATVLVAPSVPASNGQREGIPVALMEAMSTGLPVIASRLSGIPELVEDGLTGMLVPPGDHRALAQALARLAREPELAATLGYAARLRIEREFDLRSSAARLVAMFRRGTAVYCEGTPPLSP